MSTKTITRTILGALLNTNFLMGKSHTILPNTSLNQKFNIAPVPGDYGWAGRPKLGCLVIGRGGHRIATGGDGFQYTTPIQHRASDFALFDHIPWAMRNVAAGEDVTGGTFNKAAYCLRREETISIAGVPTVFAVYYGRRIDQTLNSVLVGINHVITEDGEISSATEFVPGSGNLNPTKPEPPNEGVVVTSADYLNTSAIVALTLTADEVAELRNVAMIKWGDPDRAIISEIGVCTAEMKVLSGGFTEAVGCQIFAHIVTYQQATATNQGFDMNVEVGATEPLLALNS